MPRAQKHSAHLRHSLEKLRLDVALKRERLRALHYALPRPQKREVNPELEALKAEQKAISAESARLYARHNLSHSRIELDRKRRELEKSLREEADLKANYEYMNREVNE